MDVDTPSTAAAVAAAPAESAADPAPDAAPATADAADKPATATATPNDKPQDDTPVRRESRRLRERSAAPVLVALPAHPPRAESPQNQQNGRPGGGSAPPLHFSTKHYPASAHGEGNAARRAGHTHFPRLPPDHAPGPLPDGASASFSYRGPPQPPVPGAAPPVPPPPGGTPLVLDRERPAPPAPEFEYAGGPSQQAVLANMLSQRIDQVDQLRTQLAHAEARIASLSARSNPSAALAQAEARAEAAEARLAAIKDGWRGVENYLDMLSRREAEARAAFVRTLGTGEVGVPPSVPVFGAGPTSPYLPRPPVPPNVPNRVGPNTFPALPPAPVVGGPSVIWRHESGHPRRRPGPNDPDDAEPPHKRQRPDRRRDRDREREREVRKEKARFSDSPSPPPQKEDTDLSPPIAALTASDDKDGEGDVDEEVDQIVDDVEMAGPNTSTTTRPRRSSDPSAAAAPAGTRAGSAGAKSDGAVKDLKKDGASKDKDAKTNGSAAAAHGEDVDAEGSPETDTDLSVDEELLKLTTKSRRPARGEYEGYDEYPTSRGPPAPPQEYARDDYHREYRGGPNAPGANGDPRYHHPPPGWYEGGGGGGYYEGEQYRDAHRYGGPPAPRAEFGQRNGSASAASAPWYAHLKQGSAVATNPQGQRTCRQCGLPGRYKDGKCVEKWGPGPEGPGTVCDRCRKKMKRVERRGTADASMLTSSLGPLPLHQHSFHSQSQSRSQTQPTQPQTQLSQTQLGTQYSPQRWNGNGNGRYENGAGRYDEPRGEKRYDLLPSHYGPGANGEGGDEEGVRRKSTVGTGQRKREREEVAEAKEAPTAEA